VVRATGAGTGRLEFQSGSVLAADGQGTNVLNQMNSGAFTIQAPSTSPEPEVVEYVPAVNTPSAPNLNSPTHPDEQAWSRDTEATITWEVSPGVTAVRTSVSQDPNAIPTTVADSVIDRFVAEDLPDGVSYVHVQLQNEDGWGEVGRYRVPVSTQSLDAVEVETSDNRDPANPTPDLEVSTPNLVAPADRALVQIDGGEPFEFALQGTSTQFTLPELDPGYHTAVVEVRDAAGNSVVRSVSFTIESFAAPTFTRIPERVSPSVVPVFTGTTRPNATVIAKIRAVENDTAREYEVQSNASGTFRVIPERALETGVYELTAEANDQTGAKSEIARSQRFVVQPPGYLAVGSWLVDVLSVVVPLIAMVLLLLMFSWYAWYRVRRLRRRVGVESTEVHTIVDRKVARIQDTLQEYADRIRNSRKSNELTKAEAALVETVASELDTAKDEILDEVADVEELSKQSDYAEDQ
jgi:hypothetical protein